MEVVVLALIGITLLALFGAGAAGIILGKRILRDANEHRKD